ncbi:membrane lipoprotein lipid attachment site-containing protein [Candidatus Stoquefichus sp. SB1]|uniref:membrane lipoprotein lipid attachment site-containing protein n=1 Tax=Candidatus Stoquefichus sp. SB1 TaxID=1658109 RepID=UPI00067F6C8A|nr:membrane lipoprotein lipid attachment site-containing protein [Candidatus Stoquefichus sp. SB1]
MKKIVIGLLALMLLSGCSQGKKESTFMLTRDDKVYALYNQDGDQLTEYMYKTFQEVNGVGYFVTDEKDQKGVISYKGDEIIKPGTYETLEVVDQMFYATAKTTEKQENKIENGFYKNNLLILNDEGEVIYTADNQTGIMKSGLPIILQNNEYTVLSQNGEELYKGKDAVLYANQLNNSSCTIVGFQNYDKFYHFDDSKKDNNIELEIKEKGNYTILDESSEGAILNDEKLKSMVYVDYGQKKYYQNTIHIKDGYFNANQNVILTDDNKVFVYPISGIPVLMTSYYFSPITYISRSTDIYGPHQVYKNGKLIGDLENCQLYPVAKQVYSEFFPVYVRNEGYQYYSFDNKKVIDKTFIEAEPFDENMKAIVKINDKGYSLIDEKGQVLTKEYYYRIKYIGSSYYAVYNETGAFGVIDGTGSVIFEQGYTSLPDEAIVNYDEKNYMILGKNGRSFVYDIEDDMKEIFSQEGDVVFNPKGYFAIGHQYYTFEGDLIK